MTLHCKYISFILLDNLVQNGNHQEDSSAELCQSDVINKLKIVQRIRKINASQDCRDKCINNDQCEFFRFQVQR